MLKNELIKALLDIPGNPQVALLDMVTNMNGDSGEGSSDGVYPYFSIELMDKENIPKGHKPWIAIQFTTENNPE